MARVSGSSALTPAMFDILLALTDGERHGYAIMQEIAGRVAQSRRLGPGTLYRSIHQLLELGLIEESRNRPDPSIEDERRRYYRITAAGVAAARNEARRLDEIVRTARAKHLLDSSGAA
ncbi:MAG TPA: PadR family transcriptional regulator [Chloroflexota bacterium]|nr:PadR family transcriptional regulator [Chloroflexota bacterium]